ncbi:hypothetical protein COCC4DRAFT_35996 [Bipolaris maydis ATCC 48331]|uniref:Uncharacterized protein n=2 Tax=Cochliobolus heterostrophus TaxID=5016 RepID=M2TFT3_COCH5|nr:uncharacterized protein COCC4DRAFT_35996 [Bipolaris maydis ATCC 48331]EMD96305.1 hypothetical protein COCHEDRAFT_1201134 [Bipolaris maydis C5]KAJ5030959.1 hypothetical protein J3E73DRAFT_429640 [Bipolaris maydis]ENI11165.1 hypothetical protein COCC4DRAFT_35996 [Bipolaris maydis ATCC 48331]KAJ5065981.1 hypothetical protein J3E74DRAFT_471331 [Bipolaris maydis]KAJ6201181.1 hypothetical protein J3E72DRAFT_413242 [Bipolaris maydis]
MAHYKDLRPQPFSIRIEPSKGFSHPLSSPPPTVTPRTDLPGTPFPFLSLPRELRDLVYSHTFHGRGIRYGDRIKAPTRWSQRRTLPSHLNLLLTSRQIHTEALSTLFRTQTVEISPRKLHRTRKQANQLSLSHLLCSFPLAPALLMTHVQIVYHEHSIYAPSKYNTYPFPPACDAELMITMWEHIVRDAWTLKEHFPRLIRFEACSRMLRQKMGSTFFAEQHDCHTLDESERRQRVNQVAVRLVAWLERGLGAAELAPPPWLRIVFSEESQPSTSRITFWRAQPEVPDQSNESFLRFQHEVLEHAHQLLAKKRALTQEEREASGRIWLEHCSMKRKRGRTGWCEEVDTAHLDPKND